MRKIVIEIPEESVLSNVSEIVIRLPQENQLSSDGRRVMFRSFMSGLIREWQNGRHLRTAVTYQSTLNSFMRFMHGRDLPLSDFDRLLVGNYERYLRNQGLKLNSISFYMRILRAAYNRAVDDGIIDDRAPFRHAYTGIAKTSKRAVSLRVLQHLSVMNLQKPSLSMARDMFLFSFFTRGMSFVDMAHLRRDDLHDGILTYRRQKTGTLLRIRWEPQMQALVDRYVPQYPYLLPILQGDSEESRMRSFWACQRRINNNLKQISRELGLETRLTMYVARHSWASIAHEMGVTIGVISDGMGHTSEKTTRIYLKTMDTSPLDNANLQIIHALGELSEE